MVLVVVAIATPVLLLMLLLAGALVTVVVVRKRHHWRNGKSMLAKCVRYRPLCRQQDEAKSLYCGEIRRS